jgi:hypothetical protein
LVIFEVSIFDVVEPEKRYITSPNGGGLGFAKRLLPVIPKAAPAVTAKPAPAMSPAIRRPAPPTPTK